MPSSSPSDRPNRGDAPRPVERETLFVAAAIYLSWLAVTYFHRWLPIAATPFLGGWILAWHGSLQHETIHGHPTGSLRFNTLIGSAPLSLWLPYTLYRESHIAHHASHDMTHPKADPESRYIIRRTGVEALIEQRLAQATSTLLGRLVLGPFVEIARFLAVEVKTIGQGDARRLRIWAVHLAQAALVVLWLKMFCQMSLVVYAATFIYPGAALSLLRSFAEHRAAEEPGHRIAIVERAPVLGLLFLNNNLHAAHHLHPSASWTALPGLYQQRRAQILRGNGGLVYDGYAEIFRRFLLKPHDNAYHPIAFGGRGDAE